MIRGSTSSALGRISARKAFGALTGIVLAFAAVRFVYASAILCRISYEPWTHGAAFALLALVVSVCPGLFLWSRSGLRTDDPFLPPVFVVASSLGCTMAVAWVLYLFGLFTRPAAFGLLAVWAALGVLGVVRRPPSVRNILARMAISPVEALSLSVAVLFCEGLFECVAGSPMTAWDAIVSWDKWAADIAVRNGLGGYVAGGYPQGMPLLCGLFYKVLLPAGPEAPSSLVHLLLPGFFQLFPLLLALGVLAVSRGLGTNAFWSLALVFGCGHVIRNAVKFVGYVDVPLAAFVVAAVAVVLAVRNQSEGLSRGRILESVFPVLFPVAFAKGNGFIALALATLAATVLYRGRRDRGSILAFWIAIAASSIFYLHQWFVGVWTQLGETSPFNHSLEVMSSHRDLVRPTVDHLLETVSSFGASYGFGDSIPLVLFACAVIGSFAVSLAVRKTRIPALFILFLAVAWFYLGSYDERNFLLAIALAAILVPYGFSAALRTRPRAYAALLCFVLPCCAYSMARTRLPGIAAVCGHRYIVPALVSESPEARTRHALKTSPEGVAFFTSSPAAMRASHILSVHPGYRYLRGKGVYPLQRNAYRETGPYDLAVEAKGLFVPKAPYVPMSDLSGCSGLGNRLYVAQPMLVSVPFEIEKTPEATMIRIPRTDAVPDCGFVSIGVRGAAEGVLLGIEETDSLSGTIFRPYVNGSVARLGYWVRESSPCLRFRIEPGRGADIERVEIASVATVLPCGD